MGHGNAKDLDEERPLSFPTWKDALAASPLTDASRTQFHRAILEFLHACKVLGRPASIRLVKVYLSDRSRAEITREALRWFFRTGRLAETSGINGVAAAPRIGRSPGAAPIRAQEPLPASQDLGGADWERDLIVACRSAGFLWRTEETYRGWAARFARFLSPRSPYAAATEDVGAFLTSLAVNQRASQSTQRQALNAVIFLLQEALHQTVGEIDFRRAAPGRKIPTVLTTQECAQLFAAMNGTSRLMAQLAYGSGLRLMELLRLRVHHLDLARGQVQIYQGKGDRVKGFANAAA